MEFIAYALAHNTAATQGAAALRYKVNVLKHTHCEIIYAGSTLSNDPYRTGADRKTNLRSQLCVRWEIQLRTSCRITRATTQAALWELA
jgi:hypothetical protein